MGTPPPPVNIFGTKTRTSCVYGKDAQHEFRMTTYIVILVKISLHGIQVMCRYDRYIYLIFRFRHQYAQLRLHFCGRYILCIINFKTKFQLEK